jgi:hypothetical protein
MLGGRNLFTDSKILAVPIFEGEHGRDLGVVDLTKYTIRYYQIGSPNRVAPEKKARFFAKIRAFLDSEYQKVNFSLPASGIWAMDSTAEHSEQEAPGLKVLGMMREIMRGGSNFSSVKVPNMRSEVLQLMGE